MSDGWFTRTALPARLGAAEVRILAPLGLDPALPAVASRTLHRLAGEMGWEIGRTEILVAAHGSGAGRENPARCTYRFAHALSLLSEWHRVRIGLLEQEPRLSTVAGHCAGQTICLPFFAAGGEHVVRDVPEELDAGRFGGMLCDSLGGADDIPALIAGALQAASLEIAA